MKITYILHSTNLASGSSKSFLAMIKGLIGLGVVPTVVVPNKKGIYNTLSQLGIKVITLNFRESTYPPYLSTPADYALFIPRLLGRIYLNHKATRQLADLLKEEKPDIIHTNTSVAYIGFKTSRRLGVPHIFHIREYGDLGFNHHYFPNHSSFINLMDKPDSYSICITRDIQRYHGQKGKQTSRVIYNGIMPERDTMPHTAGNCFLFIGRIEPSKGIDFLLDAYKSYSERTANPLPLHVAGSTSDKVYENSIMKRAKAIGDGSSVIFHGEIKNVEKLITDARATIIPSRFEGFGRVMPEAMFNGCLTIGRNTGGTKEQMEMGAELAGGDIALKFDTVSELTDILAEVGRKAPSEYDDYRKRAFRTVNELYTPKANAENVYKFYQDILAS